jgi:hypothetical protein
MNQFPTIIKPLEIIPSDTNAHFWFGGFSWDPEHAKISKFS